LSRTVLSHRAKEKPERSQISPSSVAPTPVFGFSADVGTTTVVALVACLDRADHLPWYPAAARPELLAFIRLLFGFFCRHWKRLICNRSMQNTTSFFCSPNKITRISADLNAI